ncbi:MAG: TIGR03619 family F420-dependent LLM class oxidoreductase [Deltaproteobacteria bacterium]|nr:TIGR03619 family F420-dependent LLM class oxidoreductase [Deltaproteobacteria bacterium]
MKLGAYLRNMGPQSTRATLLACARAAEAADLDDLWVADHIAIPPDDAEGSGGRYLDPLATLAFLAGATERIGLGTGVLVLPYRPPLATAKWVATIQELSAERLLLGVGVGWMEAEFRVVGVARGDAAVVTDVTLAFLQRCFASDEVEANGQRFLFRPRPSRPPILVGGAAPHALRRAARFGDGWMPMARDAAALRPDVERLRALMADAGKPAPAVVVLTALPLHDPAAAMARAREFLAAGATHLVHAARYDDADAFRRAVDVLATRVAPALAG